jgi:hypothetical protein
MDQRHAGRAGVIARGGPRLVVAALDQPNRRAERAHGRDLCERCGCRHEDLGGRAAPACCQGHGLRVITGARGAHASRDLRAVERGDRVRGAPDLEGAGPLQALGLE